MHTKLILCLIVVSALTLRAADNLLNVKEGLWETSVTTSGTPGMPSDAMSKMSPEARAQVEAMMKQKGISMNGNTLSVKSCVTKEKLAKGQAFSENRSNCTHTVVKSSATHTEYRMHCDAKDGTTVDATTLIDVNGTDNVKGTSHVVTTGKNGTKNVDSTFTSKYLGSDCGDIK